MKKNYINIADALKDMFQNIEFEEQPLFNHNCLTFFFDKERFVEIRIITTGQAKHYTGLQLKVIHKQNGEIASQFFCFADYIKPVTPLHPNIPKTTHIWDSGKEIGWYGNEPTDSSVKKMVDMTLRYLAILE